MNKETFYVTTPIYYASGKLHLGHVYTSTAADVIARWNRNRGKDVFFLTGSDDHGQKVAKKAKEIGIEPLTFTTSIVKQFEQTLRKVKSSHDYFIRTTNEEHKKFVQRMLQKAYDNGDIYKAQYSGLYCVDCEQYYKENELEENNICPIHKKPVDEMKEENYFFKLSKYQNKLIELYQTHPDFISPEARKNEILNRVKEGLEDISISRSKKTLDWGVELPFDKEHVAYVWFDALFNYLSALEINDKKQHWPAQVHIVGKDIMWFHTVYWPAFLMSVGEKLPIKVFGHGWWTVEGHKMGKSIGNIIDPIKVVKKFGIDEFRYFMLSAGTFGEDQDFSEKVLVTKINNELNNDLGNLVSRVHSMTNKYFEGVVPESHNLEEPETTLIQNLDFYEEFNTCFGELQFHKALDLLWKKIREVNAYINKVEPWKINDKKRLATIINTLCSSIKLFGEYIDPIMPEKAELLRKQFNFKKKQELIFEHIKQGHTLAEKENLFEKIKEKEEKQNSESKSLEEFENLNLKVGKIYHVEKVENSDKLWKLQVNLGNDKRQILSGLQGIYSQEDLENRKVVVISNLKPAKMAGEESNGMILAAENKKGEVGLLTSTLNVGDNVSWNGLKAQNSSTIKIKKFLAVKMKSMKGEVFHKDKKVENVGVDKNIEGNIC